MTSFGNITAGGRGINAEADNNGNVTVNSTGNIDAQDDGIRGFVDVNDGTVTVRSTGNITSAAGAGINVQVDEYGDVFIRSTGNITAAQEGIYGGVEDEDGSVTIISRGDINSGDQGIYGYIEGSGPVSITSTGNIDSGDVGIEAYVGDDGNITIRSLETSTPETKVSIHTSEVTVILPFGPPETSTPVMKASRSISKATEMRLVVSRGNITTTGNNDEGFNIDVYGSGDITIRSVGNVSTAGDDATGIEAYAYDGVIQVTSTGNITTRGNNADAIGAYAYYGSSIVTSNGNISTRGDYSRGIFAYGFDGQVSVTASGRITTRGLYSLGIHTVHGGTGDTTVNSSSTVSTSGYGAYGIFAQHFGVGNIAITSTGDVTTTGAYADGIFGVHSGSGDVTITSNGNVSTQGVQAFGITGLSLAGNVSVTSTGNISTSGDRGYGILTATGYNQSTTILAQGNITTTGEDADGIQSYSYGGQVGVTVGGNINTSGADADAIDINNLPGIGNSTVTILAGSTVQGGADSGDGIDFQDGNVNRVRNFGTILTLGENAIEGEGTGRELIFNFGTITGNVDLGPGANAFNNQIGGLFNSGTNVDIGAGNLLTNSGTVAPGGVGTIQTTALTGNQLQTGTGTFATDLDLTAAATDRINVTGTANLAGTVAVTVQNPALLTQQFTILSAAGGTTDNGLGLMASPILNAQLLYPNATDVVLGIDVDFTLAGLNRNQTSIANNLSLILGAGGGGLGGIFDALFNGIFTLPDYINALDQLSPEIYLNTETASLFAAEEFTNNLFSCQGPGGRNAAISEGHCVWVRPEGRWLNRDRTNQNIGFDEDVGSFSAGAQVAVAPGWFVGGGVGLETASLETDTGARSDSDRFNIGGVVKYQSGPLLIAAAISGGIADFETDRSLNFGGFTARTHSEHDVTHLSSQIRAAYLVPFANWYAKPLIDLNVTRLDRDAARERGGGEANLIVNSGEETFFSAMPALEVGGAYTLSNGSVVRPFVKAGVTFFEDDGHALTARFAGAPAGVGGFAINTEFDDVFADIEAGLSVFSRAGATLSMSYEGRISGDTDQHGFFLKGSSRF